MGTRFALFLPATDVNIRLLLVKCGTVRFTHGRRVLGDSRYVSGNIP